jgi:hypothetical protein
MGHKMAKHERPSNDDRGEIEFQFVNLKLKGSAKALEDSLRTVVATLLRQGNNGRPSPPMLTPKPAAAVPDLPVDAAEGADPDVELDDPPGDEPTIDSGASDRRRTPRKPPQFKNLAWDGPPSWKDLVAKYNPSGQWDRILLIAYWCKKAGIGDVGSEELFSAWKWAAWSTNEAPADWMQPVRDIKSQKQYFAKGTAKGRYAINELGEKYVEELKPADGA